MPSGQFDLLDATADDSMAARIKQLRTQRGLTQTDLGMLCGVSKAAVCQWEAGRQNIGLQTFLALLDALHTDFNYLVFGTDSTARKVPREG